MARCEKEIPMNLRVPILLLVALFTLSACVPGTSTATETPIVVTEEPTVEPTTVPTPESLFTPEWLAGLAPKTILLQQDYEPTFFRMEAMYEFGREPVFILYADGTLVYADEGDAYDQLRIMSVQLSPEETLALVQQVWDAGFQNLNSHTDFCFDGKSGEQMCVMDASFTILRAIQPEGTLREVKIYADFANDPAAFETITGLFRNYTHSDAQLYVPEKASLFLTEIADPSELVAQPWPLAPELLTGHVFSFETLNPIILSGQALTDFLNVLPHNFGDFYFELDGKYYSAYLVPWAPDKDYSAPIEEAFPGAQVPFSNSEVTPTPDEK
jgi:hypothetical protein